MAEEKTGEKTPEEKKIELYLRQKRMLEEFLEKGAISKTQFDKSFGDLTKKMGMTRFAENRDKTEGSCKDQ